MPTIKNAKKNNETLVSAFLRPNLAGNHGDTLKITIPKLAREITGISEKTPLQCSVDSKGRVIFEKADTDLLEQLRRIK